MKPHVLLKVFVLKREQIFAFKSKGLKHIVHLSLKFIAFSLSLLHSVLGALLKPRLKKTQIFLDPFLQNIFTYTETPIKKGVGKVKFHFHATDRFPNMALLRLRQILEKVIFLKLLDWKHILL